MRHRNRGRKLSRHSQERRALLRSLARALILSKDGRIVTTVAKAKEAAPFVERLVTLAKRGGLSSLRAALAALPDKPVIRRLFREIAPQMASRNGGATRILHLGGTKGRFRAWRIGDGAERVLFEFVGFTPSSAASGGEAEGGMRQKGIVERLRERLPGRTSKEKEGAAAP